MRRQFVGSTGRWPLRWASLLAAVVLLTACAAPTPRDTGPAPEDAAVGDSPAASVAPDTGVTPPAALALAEQAATAQRTGDLSRAEQRLERALRIAPRDATLWNQMAAVRLDQGRYQQAERLAERSLRMPGGDRALELANWRLLLAAREALGDTAGAARAREQIRRLEAEIA